MSRKVALFVEGSGSSVPSRRESGALALIWNELLPAALGCSTRPTVIPFSKRDLVALDRSKPVPTGALALDLLLDQRLKSGSFDAAIVAWDLQPPWDRDVQRCRWQETLDLYRLLGQSPHLSEPWRTRARKRHEALKLRPTPATRSHPYKLERGEIGAICMEPMFEALLQDEPGVLAGLGLTRSTAGWPRGWKDSTLQDPDRALLKPAILAAQRSRKRHRIVDQIGGDMKTCKNEWGAYLLDSLLSSDATLSRLLRRPLARRLREVLP